MFRVWAFLWFALAAGFVQAGQNVVVVLDDSGSMNETLRSDRRLAKIAAAKQALLTVLEQLPPDARVGIVLLNGPYGRGEWVYPLGPVDQATIRQAIQGIGAGGGTPLGERMKTGADALLALREKDHYGSYRLLIVTDGEATDGNLVQQYLPDILTRGIWVDVIGVDMAGDHTLATEVHTYRRADDPASLEQAIREVFAESTGGPGDADESDFELLAAIPDEVAAAALAALAQSGNHPIGEKPATAAAFDDLDRARAAPPVPRPREAERTGAWGLSCVGFGVLFVLGLLIMMLSTSRRRQARGR